MLRLLLLSLLCLGVHESHAQLWRFYRHEFSFGLGAANCFTDVGGGSGDGGYLKDLNFAATRPAAQIGYRYRISPKISFKSSLSFIQISGSDEFSRNEGRKNRNLNFRTNIYELGLQFEYYFKQEPLGKLNTLGAKRRGHKGPEMGFYGLAGIAPFLYNPLGEAENGNWYRLRPLHTEGQGLEGGPSEYGSFGIAFKIGAGAKWIINRQLNIGFEASVNYTNTDYLDDVSDTYYDFSQTSEDVSGLTTQMADKRLSGARGRPGGIRGNPENNDVYFNMFVTLNYKLAADQKIVLFSIRRKHRY